MVVVEILLLLKAVTIQFEEGKIGLFRLVENPKGEVFGVFLLLLIVVGTG